MEIDIKQTCKFCMERCYTCHCQGMDICSTVRLRNYSRQI